MAIVENDKKPDKWWRRFKPNFKSYFNRWGKKPYVDIKSVVIGDTIWFTMALVITFGFPVSIIILGTYLDVKLWIASMLATLTLPATLYITYKIMWDTVRKWDPDKNTYMQASGLVGTTTFTSGGAWFDTCTGGKFFGPRRLIGFTRLDVDILGVRTRHITVAVMTASKEFAAQYVDAEDKDKFDKNELNADSPAKVTTVITGKIDAENHYRFRSIVGEEEEVESRLVDACTAIIPGKVSQKLSLAMLLQEKYLKKLIVNDVFNELKKLMSDDFAYLVTKLEMVGIAPPDIQSKLEDVIKSNVDKQTQEIKSETLVIEAKGQANAQIELARGKATSEIIASEASIAVETNKAKAATAEVTVKAAAIKADDTGLVEKLINTEYAVEIAKNTNPTLVLTGSKNEASVTEILLANMGNKSHEPKKND